MLLCLTGKMVYKLLCSSAADANVAKLPTVRHCTKLFVSISCDTLFMGKLKHDFVELLTAGI